MLCNAGFSKVLVNHRINQEAAFLLSDFYCNISIVFVSSSNTVISNFYQLVYLRQVLLMQSTGYNAEHSLIALASCVESLTHGSRLGLTESTFQAKHGDYRDGYIITYIISLYQVMLSG